MTDEQTIRVRRAGRADIPAVDALLARAYPRLLKNDYPASVLVTAIPLICRAQPALVTSGTYYLAEDAAEPGGPLGVGGWTLRDPTSGRSTAGEGNIRHFGTDPAATRRGVARAIMARCLSDAWEAGVRHMTCFSTRTAVPFYRAAGFEEHGEVEIELRPGVRFPAVRMTRALGA